MAIDEDDDIRILEPDLFIGDEDRPRKPEDKAVSIRFLQGPKEPPKRLRLNIDEEKKVLANTLKWAQFLSDPRILESNNRTQLKAYLDKLLEGISKRYASPTSDKFPGNLEVVRLIQTVTALAKLLGVKKADFGDLFSAMKRIENRWNKMPLIAFADALVDKLLRLPLCPLSVVYQAVIRGAPHKETLAEIRNFLSGKHEADFAATPWDKWFLAIRKLTFPTASLLWSDETDMLRVEFLNGNSAQKRLLAYLALMDLKRQQLEWDNRYGKQIQPTLQWLYLLQRREDYQKLQQVFGGNAFSPDQVRKILAGYDNRERRNRSYKKSRTIVRRVRRTSRPQRISSAKLSKSATRSKK